MTIADELHDTANEIRDIIKDDILVYGDKLTAEIMHFTTMMDSLRDKIDAFGSPAKFSPMCL
jgi:hypothetical protein